jgi:hypothetical protein
MRETHPDLLTLWRFPFSYVTEVNEVNELTRVNERTVMEPAEPTPAAANPLFFQICMSIWNLPVPFATCSLPSVVAEHKFVASGPRVVFWSPGHITRRDYIKCFCPPLLR